MRKCLSLLLTVILLLLSVAWAEGPALSLKAPEDMVRPGKAVTITFTAPAAGLADICVTDDQGETISVVVEGYEAYAGENILWWNGTYQGIPAPEGAWQLAVSMNGETVYAPITVGSYAPYLTNLYLESESVAPGEHADVHFYASVDGEVTVGLRQEGRTYVLDTVAVAAGENIWESADWETLGLTDGAAVLTLTLTDGEGFLSNEMSLALTLTGFADEAGAPAESEATQVPAESDPGAEQATMPELTLNVPDELEEEVILEREDILSGDAEATQDVFTPAYGSPYTDTSLNYWTLPMDITDEEAVWEVLMQPITVIYSSTTNAEKTQAVVYAEPSEDSEGVGVVTRITQGVHVLENLDNGWSLIECYSASFYDSKVKRWNELVQGYVPTNTLKEVTPQSEYGIVIDKLTQRLYLFKEGKLFSTLLVSTGLANASQPYNETRSGEFLLTSAVGAFASGNLTCAMALRFDGGDLLHEVPYATNADGTKNYGYEEPKLGTKASHGCIRVQRRKTPEGVNMTWLWNNRIKNTKLLIWEDWQGRQIPIPEDDFQLYYNPNGGTMYHSQETCNSTKEGIVLTAFNYSELDEEPYASLTRCTYCAPVLRREEIEAINETYAPGGDHDPILTAAREAQRAKEAGE